MKGVKKNGAVKTSLRVIRLGDLWVRSPSLPLQRRCSLTAALPNSVTAHHQLPHPFRPSVRSSELSSLPSPRPSRGLASLVKCALTSPFSHGIHCGLPLVCLFFIDRDRICGSSDLSLIGQKDVVAFARRPFRGTGNQESDYKADVPLLCIVYNRPAQTNPATHAYQASRIAPSSSLPPLIFLGAVQMDPKPRQVCLVTVHCKSHANVTE